MTKIQWAGLVGLVVAALGLIALMLLAVGVRQYPPVSLEQARLEALEKGNAALVAERDELQRKEQHAVGALKSAEDRANRLEKELRAAQREVSECGPPKITFPR